MKKILTILGIISLLEISITNLVACNKLQYTKEELKKLKEENKINTKYQEIKDNLEWIVPQEKPFLDNFIDKKYYYVIWRYKRGTNWRITKFKNDTYNIIKIDEVDGRILNKIDLGMGWKDLYVLNKTGFIKYVIVWKYDNKNYIKAVYRWNLEESNLPNLNIDKNGNIKVANE